MISSARLVPAGRRPGRPVGADSVETRARILRAAREVISERGYEAANFQAIAERAGLSRPTMHYYFHTKEQVYETLLHEAHSVVADCIAEASREGTLLKQLSAFIVAAHRADLGDRSMARFIVASHLECERHPQLRHCGSPVVTAMRAFYASTVVAAIERRELPAETDVTMVVELLVAMVWGVGFYVGFVDSGDNMTLIAKQLQRLFARGLLDGPASRRSLTIDPHAPAAIAADEFARTWPGLALIIDVPAGQSFIAAHGAQPLVVSGDFTGERVRSAFYRAYRVESFVEGIGRYDTLDSVAWP